MSTIHQIILISTVAAFIILFMNKTGLRIKLRDYCDIQNKRLIAEMLDCDFCLSFWVCTVLTIIFIASGFSSSLLVAICSTPITRYLL